ncbi:MAG: hypothetical protein PT938_01000 [Solobacterium sp.]|nr:hypothetical protein [Solobacterium sp.]MDY2953890.1 hypothetical protein [Erysipelotrichaceae bacterium]
MRKLFSEFGLSMLALTCSIIVIDVLMKQVDISEILVAWMERLL